MPQAGCADLVHFIFRMPVNKTDVVRLITAAAESEEEESQLLVLAGFCQAFGMGWKSTRYWGACGHVCATKVGRRTSLAQHSNIDIRNMPLIEAADSWQRCTSPGLPRPWMPSCSHCLFHPRRQVLTAYQSSVAGSSCESVQLSPVYVSSVLLRAGSHDLRQT